MSKYKFDDTALQVMLSEMRTCIRIYDDAADVDKMMPTLSNDMENVRWTLGALLTHLDDEAVRDRVGPEVSKEIDRAMEIKSELIKNIAEMWGAESKE